MAAARGWRDVDEALLERESMLDRGVVGAGHDAVVGMPPVNTLRAHRAAAVDALQGAVVELTAPPGDRFAHDDEAEHDVDARNGGFLAAPEFAHGCECAVDVAFAGIATDSSIENGQNSSGASDRMCMYRIIAGTKRLTTSTPPLPHGSYCAEYLWSIERARRLASTFCAVKIFSLSLNRTEPGAIVTPSCAERVK